MRCFARIPQSFHRRRKNGSPVRLVADREVLVGRNPRDLPRRNAARQSHGRRKPRRSMTKHHEHDTDHRERHHYRPEQTRHVSFSSFSDAQWNVPAKCHHLSICGLWSRAKPLLAPRRLVLPRVALRSRPNRPSDRQPNYFCRIPSKLISTVTSSPMGPTIVFMPKSDRLSVNSPL